MAAITPEIMSAWLRMQPAAAANGLHTQVSAALWDIRVEPDCIWEATTMRSTSCHILWFALESFRLDYEVDGRPLWSGLVEPHTAHVVRAGESVHGVFRDSGRVLHLYLPHELLVEVAQEFGRPEFELMDRGLQVNAQLQGLAGMLLERIRRQDRLARLEMDAVGLMACAHLLRSWSSTPDPGDLKGRLGSLQARRAIAFLNDHLHCEIGVADVAAYVGLSQYHFTRAFRRTVGVSPHRFLLLRRLDKAKELLSGTALSIAAVAERVGYTDSNQLARLFRKELRITPTAYRRQYGRLGMRMVSAEPCT